MSKTKCTHATQFTSGTFCQSSSAGCTRTPTVFIVRTQWNGQSTSRQRKSQKQFEENVPDGRRSFRFFTSKYSRLRFDAVGYDLQRLPLCDGRSWYGTRILYVWPYINACKHGEYASPQNKGGLHTGLPGWYVAYQIILQTTFFTLTFFSDPSVASTSSAPSTSGYCSQITYDTTLSTVVPQFDDGTSSHITDSCRL